MSIFFKNIDYIDALLNPNRRGFSVNLLRELNLTKTAVHNWKKGGVPQLKRLTSYTKILSKVLSEHYNFKIEITPEQLRDGDVKQIIDEALKKGENNKALLIKELGQKYSVDNNINIDYFSDEEPEALKEFLESREGELMCITPEEIKSLKSIRFRIGKRPTIKDYIDMLYIMRTTNLRV